MKPIRLDSKQRAEMAELSSEFGRLKKEAGAIARKMETLGNQVSIVKTAMWDRLIEMFPEKDLDGCTFDREEYTIKSVEQENPLDKLKGMMGRMGLGKIGDSE